MGAKGILLQDLEGWYYWASSHWSAGSNTPSLRGWPAWFLQTVQYGRSRITRDSETELNCVLRSRQDIRGLCTPVAASLTMPTLHALHTARSIT